MKSCVLPVVFGEGSPGVFWHEACGHNLETETGKSGPFWNSRGKMIASRKVTLIDDGSVPGLCGYERMDDEWHPTQNNILIDHGKMVLQMADILGGRLTGTGSTGSAAGDLPSRFPESR
jgi:TldD protein